MDEMERVGLGFLNRSPRELVDYTPSEFRAELRAKKWAAKTMAGHGRH